MRDALQPRILRQRQPERLLRRWRISSSNLEQDNRLGMVFLFPGLEIFLRVNGRGMISKDPDLLG